MSQTVTGGGSGGGGANFPGGDLCSGTGTTVSVGAGLTLAGGALSANNPFPGPVSDLLAADGTSVTVGSGLTLAAGTLAASGGGGGITELTGEVTAGPASGSTGATVRGITGNAGGVLGYYRIPVQNSAYFQSAAGNTPISWDVAGSQEVRIGGLEDGGYGVLPYARVRVNTQATISLINCLPNFMSARMFTYGAQAVIQGGFQNANHIRVTGGTIAVDDANRTPNTVGYFIECAYAAGSGGQTIVTPATPWPATFPNSAGRTIVVADVLGTCSTPDPITLVDPAGRTFNGAQGPYTIDKPSNVCTATLDSTLNNWILSFAHGSPF